jgi:hypothetical protein
VKTDDRGTRQRNEAEASEATVVRLSDWLAPDDELVPFGPRAHPAAREPTERFAESDAGSPPASGFWDGDTSVHAAVPGPGVVDELGAGTAERGRYRRPVLWRPTLRSPHPFGWASLARERFTDPIDRISWPWAAGGLAFVALVAVVLVTALGGSSSGHHEPAAQAGIGDQSRAGLSGTLGEIGAAGRAAGVADLQRLPSVNRAAGTIGAAARRARALKIRQRHHAVVTPTSASHADASTAGSVATSTTTAAPTETTPAPTETQPVQTTPAPTPTSGGGGSSSGGAANSGSQKQPAFGATGSLGPGSSPNG